MSKGAKIAIAIALGLFAALLGIMYIEGQRERLLGSSEMVRVYVATGDIKPNTPLEPGMLTTKEVPRAFLQPQSITVNEVPDKAKLKGVTLVAIKENEQIIRTKLHEGAPPPLSAELKTRRGMVAVGVRVDTSPAAVASLIRPGDRVDVLASFVFEKSRDEDFTEIRPIFQNVEVMAVNDVTASALHMKPHTAEAAGEPQQSKETKTLTLALPPAAAQQIILAQQLGDIWFVLRAPGDGARHAYEIWNNERLIGSAYRLWKKRDPREAMLEQLTRR